MPGLNSQAISAKSHHVRASITRVARQQLPLTVVEASSDPLGVHEKCIAWPCLKRQNPTLIMIGLNRHQSEVRPLREHTEECGW